jgi:glycine/D-amino acid oxidase-like deaminating enzyme
MSISSREIAGDVIVIGGGLAGLTTAIALARKKIPVKIIYDHTDKLAGTPACHGISTIKGILESDAALFGLKLLGHRGFSAWLAEIEALIGIKRPDNAWTVGVTERFPDRQDFQKDIGWIYRKDFMGAKQVILRAENKDNYVEAYYPGDWWIDPSYLILTLQLAAAKLGVTTEDAIVCKMTTSDKSVNLTLNSGQEVASTCVILCGGARIVNLMSMAGIYKYDWFAVPGYTFKAEFKAPDICLVKRTSGLTSKAGILHWGAASETAIALTEQNEGLEAGAGINSLKRVARVRTKDEEAQIAELHLHKFMSVRSLREFKKVEVRWGVRVRNRSRAPATECIKKLPGGGLWINAGYYKSGVILSWMMAEGLANTVAANNGCPHNPPEML